MRIQPEYMSFRNRCMISSSYEFQAHQQRSQRRCCFSQNALLWFEVLPDAHRFVDGAPSCSAMQRDTSPGRREACDSRSEGTRFRQSHQCRPEHPGVSDGNWGCCWCGRRDVTFNVGNKVWLSTRHFRTTRQSVNLDYYRTGRYTVSKIINKSAFKLH